MTYTGEHIHEDQSMVASATEITVSKEDAVAAAQIALDKKALDVVLLEVGEVTSFADYFLICSGRTAIQVKAIVNAIEQHLKEQGIRPLHIEGLSESRWVLLDYDELIIHVFLDETRHFYDLERLWSDVPRTTFEEPVPPLRSVTVNDY
jgi:ribosome-associated protein